MRWAWLVAAVLAAAGAAAAFALGAVYAAVAVSGAAVAAAIVAGVLWIGAVIRMASENAMHKDSVSLRQRGAERGARGAESKKS